MAKFLQLSGGRPVQATVTSSGGQGGINYLNLSTAWAFVNSDSSDIEASIGNWVTYNDSSQIPVDLTGGTATQLTLSATTTAGEVLDGTTSLKVVKAAANAQGQGISCVFNVPVAYQGKQSEIIIPFKILSGSVTSGDIQIYCYDVTNSQLITPFNGSVIGTQGTIRAIFASNAPASTPANIQMRLGIHFASTSATAVTLVFDDIKVQPTLESSVAGIITDWSTYSMTIGGTTGAPTKGTVVFDTAQYRMVGSDMELRYDYRQSAGGNGGGTNAIYTFPLPSGYTIDTSKLTPSTDGRFPNVGFARVSNNTAIGSSTQFTCLVVAYDSSNLALVAMNGSVLGFIAQGNGSLNGELSISYSARVPITGKSSNITLSSSSTYMISSVIANGTRVTSTPAALGQYRTYTKTSSALTGTDNAPTTGPSATNGMLIYSVPFASAGTSGQTNRWEIFVGTNCNIFLQTYSSTGKTGWVTTDLFYPNTTTAYGLQFDYDPTTGVAVVDAIVQSGSVTTRNVGIGLATAGGGVTDLTNCYFDIKVSQNALGVGVQRPRSEITLNTGNGFGSSNTVIRRFSVLEKSIGTAITYTDSSTAGASFTINEDGIYAITYTDSRSPSGSFGLSKNSNQLTTNIETITATNRIGVGPVQVASFFPTVTSVLNCSTGDIIRAHSDNGSGYSSTAEVRFCIVKISD